MRFMGYKTITLSELEMEKCLDFSKASAESQQAIEFGQRDTNPRPSKEIARDNLIGKMAEVAVARMLREEYGIHFPVNFDIYPRGEWDDCDVQIRGWNIDIKSTRIGRWLLFEVDKLRMRKNQPINNLPDAVIMCRTPWDIDNDSPLGTVELVGTISLKSLLSSDQRIKRLKKGECIPGTRVRLQAENLAVHFNDLSHDWDQIIQYMLDNQPPEKSSYVITG